MKICTKCNTEKASDCFRKATAITEKDMLSLHYYNNYQPMWKEDNLKKSSNYKGSRYSRGAIVSPQESC